MSSRARAVLARLGYDQTDDRDEDGEDGDESEDDVRLAGGVDGYKPRDHRLPWRSVDGR